MSDGWVQEQPARPLSALLYAASGLCGAGVGVCATILWLHLAPAPALLWTPLLVLAFFIPGVALAVIHVIRQDRLEARRRQERSERRYPYRFGVTPTELPAGYPRQPHQSPP